MADEKIDFHDIIVGIKDPSKEAPHEFYFNRF